GPALGPNLLGAFQASKQRQGHRLEMVVFHPHLQFALAEPGLEALAGLGLAGAADRLTALVQQYAVAARQRRQRADDVKRLRQALQLLAAAVQSFLHGARHALGQMFQALAQQFQRTSRMLCTQAGVEPRQTLLARAKATVDAAQQALLQIVDALGLLLQALAGMAQAAGQAIEARAFTMQAFAHAQQQALAQAFQALANIRTAGR